MNSLEKKIAALAQRIEKPLDFICHCGDICHSGGQEDYEEVKEFFQHFFPGIPLLVTVGNHDTFSAMERVFSTKEHPIEGYVRHFDELQVISFNSCNGGSGVVTEEQVHWILEKIRESHNKSTILFTHHHFFPQQSPMPCAELHDNVKLLLDCPQIKGVFTGHTHYHFKKSSIPYYAVDSLSFQGVDSGLGYLNMKESSGFQLFSYENCLIQLEERGNLGFQKDLGIAFF